MSNIGKRIINISAENGQKNLKIKLINFKEYKQLIISNGRGNPVKFINFPSEFELELIPGQIRNQSEKQLSIGLKISLTQKGSLNAFYGTLNSLIQQMVSGFLTPFERTLILNGVGYKIEQENEKNRLKFTIGYSHPIYFEVPQNIQMKLINQNTLILKSESLQDLTQFINKIVQIKPAYKDKYKGKGFKIECAGTTSGLK